ncbi:hypothetical protein SUNI508_06468 [Seiridium unicorne]|uniref:Uncharacterized protein n=1 Tax=Seiridium unicorne TaxID=138068 RepID=A0ABR2V0K6_9PEZI
MAHGSGQLAAASPRNAKKQCLRAVSPRDV